MKTFQKRIFVPLLLFFVLIVIFFRPVFLQGKVPFPGDLLLAQYQPWRSSSYAGLSPGGVPNKAQYFDTLRQIYPWKTFAISEIKQGRFPLWNPHNFSGSPLFANFQSSILYPLNFFYLLFSQIDAWTILVLLQPLFSLIAVYLLARKYTISRTGSIIASISYAFCLYQTAFLEYNTIGHFMYLVSFAMLFVEYCLEKRIWGFFLLSCIIASSGFAGHVQLFAASTLYILLYAVFRSIEEEKSLRKSFFTSLPIVIFLVLGIGISLIQLLPGVELIQHSARSSHDPSYLLKNLLIRPSQLILYMIPDLFGNPATKNYLVSFSYPSKALYIGLVGFFFSVVGMLSVKANHRTLIIFLLTLLVILIVFLNPLSAIYYLNLPLFLSSSPSNYIFFISLGLCLLAGFGFDEVLKKTKESVLVLMGLWITMLSWSGFLLVTHSQFSRSNVAYSFLILLVFSIILLARFKYAKIVFLNFLFVILLTSDLLYFFTKFNPFVPRSFVYPPTNIGTWISEHTGLNRAWGYSFAGVEPNFATQVGFYSPDGYDPLYPKEYGEFIQSAKNGKISSTFTDETRSDAVINPGFGAKEMTENTSRLRVLSVAGVMYILDKSENGSTEETFPSNLFANKANVDDFHIFTYLNASPRFFLTNKFLLYSSPDNFSQTFFSSTFDPKSTILLEKVPKSVYQGAMGTSETKLVTYTPSSIVIATKSDQASLLFLSDTYFPGWYAFVDGNSMPILRANLAFRAVEVPKGSHVVTFSYKPKSFSYGLSASIVSIIMTIGGTIVLWLLYRKKKRED